MNPEAIFLPMLATMTLTAIVWFYMYSRRIPDQQHCHAAVLSLCRVRTGPVVYVGQGTNHGTGGLRLSALRRDV
jgi:hypothetical protein